MQQVLYFHHFITSKLQTYGEVILAWSQCVSDIETLLGKSGGSEEALLGPHDVGHDLVGPGLHPEPGRLHRNGPVDGVDLTPPASLEVLQRGGFSLPH